MTHLLYLVLYSVSNRPSGTCTYPFTAGCSKTTVSPELAKIPSVKSTPLPTDITVSASDGNVSVCLLYLLLDRNHI